ncbi:NAD(P)/FAD-dependent oxidoreductase [Spongisporangium articulatum]|uniref:NAD(P)/FAD-dependent oxidoreductase n=1 Tax=Spongisporangium articulatum TaxID=3362603 RepID=A0ABW8AU59_9ACTN
MSQPTAGQPPATCDVLIVGAGLAGLACARVLAAQGVETVVVDAADGVGGRVRSEKVYGFTVDRGFQLLNPAYPEVRRVIDVEHLRLQRFPAALVVATDGHKLTLADPRHAPRELPGTARALLGGRLGSPREFAAFAAWALGSARRAPRELTGGPDGTWGAELDARGITGSLRRRVVEPFLAGVLGERDGSTSHRYLRLLVRSFVRAAPGLPWRGMQALPDQLAAALPADVPVHLGVRALAVRPGQVVTDHGEVHARVVVVATDPAAASELVGLPAVATHALTTFWHVSGELPTRSAALHVDGDATGPVVNSVVISNTARGYSPDERSLIATTVLGATADAETERAVLSQLSRMYRASTTWWDLARVHALPAALTAMPPPREVRQPVDLAPGLVVAGDHRDTASLQGALVSGRRAAGAVLEQLRTGGLGLETRGVA